MRSSAELLLAKMHSMLRVTASAKPTLRPATFAEASQGSFDCKARSACTAGKSSHLPTTAGCRTFRVDYARHPLSESEIPMFAGDRASMFSYVGSLARYSPKKKHIAEYIIASRLG